jgi:hypothetical protein
VKLHDKKKKQNPTCKNQMLFCTLSMNNLKRKMKKTIPFTIASRGIKYLGINLSKILKTVKHSQKKLKWE